ncbi:MAG: DegT/DnrJ/EryC1/StrS family aminotransferase [Candidatus Woesearchaeota archaeon]|jgi:hypothetical protein
MDAKKILFEKTGKSNISFTNRCNDAIKCAYNICAKMNSDCKKVLCQKEGGWMTYDQFALKMGFDVSYVDTNDSIVDLEDLKKKVSSGEYLFIIFNRIPGYFCKNDVSEINKICHEYNVLTIEDQCAELALTNSDFIVCSFGRWKPLNLGHGGFIASNNLLDVAIECKYPELSSEVLPFLLNCDERVSKLKEIVLRVKKELTDLKLNVVRPEFTELNVIVSFQDDLEKQKILDYCALNTFEFEECPRDIRINKKAISIEIKRMDTNETK